MTGCSAIAEPSFLVSGVRLERYEQWVESSPVRLTSVRAGLHRSVAQTKSRRNIHGKADAGVGAGSF